MQYDPIKNIFARFVSDSVFLRKSFYRVLNVMFLRSWYVRKELKGLRKKFEKREINAYDAGTGFGQYSFFMAKRLKPINIYAVDVKSEWMEDCKKFFRKINYSNVSFGVEDLTQINHENKFDLIVCVDVMEHIEDDIKVFENFYRALKQGGFAIINSPSLFGGSDVHGEGDESFVDEHARDGYSHEDLKSKTEPLGFKIYKSKYTYGFWGDKAWRLGIKYPMKALNLSKAFFIILPFYYLLTLPFFLLMNYLDFIFRSKKGSGINFIIQKAN